MMNDSQQNKLHFQKNDGSFYPQVPVEECKYIVKKKEIKSLVTEDQVCMNINLKMKMKRKMEAKMKMKIDNLLLYIFSNNKEMFLQLLFFLATGNFYTFPYNYYFVQQ